MNEENGSADRRIAQATSLFEQGFNCAQAIFAPFAEECGLDQATALKVACAFGGGMAASGEVCGAVSGALMALGLVHGRSSLADQESKAKTYALTREFWSQFRARRGSLVCRELLGEDVGTPEGVKRAHERCPALVRDTAQILCQLLPPRRK